MTTSMTSAAADDRHPAGWYHLVLDSVAEVVIVMDAAGRENVSGDGINTAQRYIRVALVHDEQTTREALTRLAQVL